MNHNVKELIFQYQPIHVFEHDGKIAFLAQQVGYILDIKDPRRTIQRSKSLETGVDFDVIPTDLIPEADKMSVSGQNRVTILYLPGFFLFVLRLNSIIAVPFTRWAIREAIPQAFESRQKKELSEDMLYKMISQERQGSLFARKILTDHGYMAAPEQNKQLTFGEGGDHE